MPFTAHHHGTNKLGLARLLGEFADDQWIGEQFVQSALVHSLATKVPSPKTSKLPNHR